MNEKKDLSVEDGTAQTASTATGAAIGAITGATIGAVGGPPGMAVGAALGAVVGGATGATAAATVNPAEYNDHFQKLYPTSSYYQPGYDWNDYQPAYEYGYHTFGHHQGKRFEDVEPQLAQKWEAAREGSRLEWANARQAVREGWHYLERAVPGDADRDGR